jgi:tetratricopeptide (TPR) repeat protein
MRLAVALAPFWNLRAAYLEGRGWLTDFLARTDPAPTALRARTLYGVGELAIFQMDYPPARSSLEQSVAMFQALGDPAGMAYPRIYLAYLLFVEGESDLAFSLWDACAKHFRSAGDSWGLAWTLSFLGRAARDTGDFEANRIYNHEAAVLLRSIGDRFALSIVVSHLGLSDYRQRDYQAARAQFEYRVAVGRELASKGLLATPTVWLGFTALAEDDLAVAAGLFREALTLARPVGLDGRLLQALEGLAAVAQRRGTLKRAAHLWAARQAFISAWKILLPPESHLDAAREISDLRARLGEASFAAAWSEGSNMDLDQVLEEAFAI